MEENAARHGPDTGKAGHGQTIRSPSLMSLGDTPPGCQ